MTDPTSGDRGPRDEGHPEYAVLGTPASVPSSGGRPSLRAKKQRAAREAAASGSPADTGGAEPAPTPAKGNARRTRSRGPRLGASALGLLVFVLLLAIVPALASGFEKTPRDKVGISYGGGPFEGSHYQRIVEPGSSLFFNGIADPLYLYPADQQNYIVSKARGEGASDEPDSVVAPSSDRVQVEYQVAVYYKLNTDRLREFHEELGLKYEAYSGDGWERLIEDTFRQQIENTLQEETRRHPVGDIYGDAELLRDIQQSAQATLSERLQAATGEKFFCGPSFDAGKECEDPTFVIKAVSIPENVAKAFESNRVSQVAIQTKRNEVAQREEEAKGIAALNQALRDTPDYVVLKAIESGKIGFWVLPSDGNLTLDTDGSGGAPAAPTSGDAAGG